MKQTAATILAALMIASVPLTWMYTWVTKPEYHPRPLGDIEAMVRYEDRYCYVLHYDVRYEHSHLVCYPVEAR